MNYQTPARDHVGHLYEISDVIIATVIGGTNVAVGKNINQEIEE